MGTVPEPSFGALLRRARRAARLSQEALAERAGISVDAISLLERGLTRAPQQETLDLLAAARQLEAAERPQWEQTTRGLRLPSNEALPLLESASSPPAPPAPALSPLLHRPALPTGTVTFLFTDIE